MHITNVVEHSAHGHDYEIIVAWTGTEWRVAIRDKHQQLVGPVFSMTLEAAQDIEHYHKQPAIDALVEVAKDELDSGRVKSTASQKKA